MWKAMDSEITEQIPPARNVGILISGRGSNMLSILEARAKGELDADIRVVISNKKKAGGLAHAEAHGVPAVVVSHQGHPDRESFEDALIEVLRAHNVEVVVLAGFMRLLTGRFLRAFPRRVLNIHPSLLPAFPGVDGQRQAFDYGVRVTGCTVHLVDEGTDSGPIVDQAVVPVIADDDRDSLASRILAQEHRVLPRALGWLLAGRLHIRGRRVEVQDPEEG
jgi:phosphoribosylglycinamide formyltransferase 1